MQGSKKLFVNTFVMYSQTIISMIVAIFISRILLNSLGVEDFGLYNVIGGVVALITIITSGLSTATQRSLSYELGKVDNGNIIEVFNSCISIHILFALIFLVLSETVGLWFMNNKLQIPEGREYAAICVFHFSVLSVCFNIVSVPYSSLIMSHERMIIYACVGLIDSFLKLLIACVLVLYQNDRLILYAFLMCGITIVDFIIYCVYCLVNYNESHIRFVWDKNTFNSIFSFAKWTIVGQGGMLAANQGNNILINMFYGVKANAAMGVAGQVNAAITSLTNNFFIAYQPQITKSYASENYDYLTRLVFTASKLSFLIIVTMSIPVILNMDTIFSLWLGVVPEFTTIFCLIFMVSSMINSLGNPFLITIYATGKIKSIQGLSTFFYLLDLVVIYFLFNNLGWPVYCAPAVKLFIDLCITALRIVLASRLCEHISLKQFCRKVLLPISATIILNISFVSLTGIYLRPIIGSFLYTILVLFVFVILSFIICMDINEREIVCTFISKFKRSKI